MKAWIVLAYVCTTSLSLFGNEKIFNKEIMETEINQDPQYLYKILSLRNWQATQNRETVALSAEDDAFVHFSKEDQIERILTKYWSDAQQFVILKIDTSKLEGRLVYEANAGGVSKYFHLYDGFIPLAPLLNPKLYTGSL